MQNLETFAAQKATVRASKLTSNEKSAALNKISNTEYQLKMAEELQRLSLHGHISNDFFRKELPKYQTSANESRRFLEGILKNSSKHRNSRQA